jgi:hypothetical protein
VDERDVLNAWRTLFRGESPTTQTWATAESLLNRLNGESPIRIRLAAELDELRASATKHKKKRTGKP